MIDTVQRAAVHVKVSLFPQSLQQAEEQSKIKGMDTRA
jgi:hypothetical protein